MGYFLRYFTENTILVLYDLYNSYKSMARLICRLITGELVYGLISNNLILRVDLREVDRQHIYNQCSQS